METNDKNIDEIIQQHYQYAVDQLVRHGKTVEQVRYDLLNRGLQEHFVNVLLDMIAKKYVRAKKKMKVKSMALTLMWVAAAVGGYTMHWWYIFWGAVVFGVVQILWTLYLYR